MIPAGIPAGSRLFPRELHSGAGHLVSPELQVAWASGGSSQDAVETQGTVSERTCPKRGYHVRIWERAGRSDSQTGTQGSSCEQRITYTVSSPVNGPARPHQTVHHLCTEEWNRNSPELREFSSNWAFKQGNSVVLHHTADILGSARNPRGKF